MQRTELPTMSPRQHIQPNRHQQHRRTKTEKPELQIEKRFVLVAVPTLRRGK